ncbi:hypothetical protein [Mesorhizobium muleiense]|uniref:hypothetical protein n=1 Tax=Mesorhizobium muleiense TaxID=1004279 RepID=UPI001F3784FE|nr:hypothetical protein [Mesorhizobium muleiense]MCF6113925.1 hypothetical protein [Mesorhizobium muleiense]
MKGRVTEWAALRPKADVSNEAAGDERGYKQADRDLLQGRITRKVPKLLDRNEWIRGDRRLDDPAVFVAGAARRLSICSNDALSSWKTQY